MFWEKKNQRMVGKQMKVTKDPALQEQVVGEMGVGEGVKYSLAFIVTSSRRSHVWFPFPGNLAGTGSSGLNETQWVDGAQTSV